MYFENTGHLGGVAEDDIQRISMTLAKFPKFPVYFGDVILIDPTQMSGFRFQGTVTSRSLGRNSFTSGFPSCFTLVKSLGKAIPALASTGGILQTVVLTRSSIYILKQINCLKLMKGQVARLST
jgi:hypothetical protein